jgi:hypothetical protein
MMKAKTSIYCGLERSDNQKENAATNGGVHPEIT